MVERNQVVVWTFESTPIISIAVNGTVLNDFDLAVAITNLFEVLLTTYHNYALLPCLFQAFLMNSSLPVMPLKFLW